jgi:hypothetical protein
MSSEIYDSESGCNKSATKRVALYFPPEMIHRVDAQAKARGVTRQAVIKMWLADRLGQAA